MISNDLRDEVQTLLPLIPELKEIIKYQNARRSTIRDGIRQRQENSQERFKNAFRQLSRALNAAFSPIVLVLDDLQWADMSSLQVIDYLVSDMQNPNRLMVIGCYRSEDVSRAIEELKTRQLSCPFHVTEIELGNCQVDHVHEMIMSILSTESQSITQDLAAICYRRTVGNPFFVTQFMIILQNEALLTFTQDLAAICYRRTVGNPFFVTQFMIILQNEALLTYNPSSIKWEFNVDEAEKATKFTSNVVDLLRARMKKMPAKVQLLLQYAACIGTCFSQKTIEIVWREHGNIGPEENADLSNLRNTVHDTGFIEKKGRNGFRFVHDKIQEAAMSLSDRVNSSFIGKTLMFALNAEKLEDELFDEVDLINRGDVATRPELAALNLRAAEKARNLASFQSARSYVEFGAAMLPRNHWKTHRDLTLALYTLGAEAELAEGYLRAAAVYCNAVFQQKDCTAMEKAPLRMAVINMLYSGDSNMKQKALDLCLDLLKELDYTLIYSNSLLPIQTLYYVVKTVKTLYYVVKTVKTTKKKLAEKSVGVMTNPRHLLIMELLSKIANLSYHLELLFLNSLATCHLVLNTLKFGGSHLSGFGLVIAGVLARVLLKEDFSTALAFTESALSIQKSIGTFNEGRTTWNAYALCLSWSTTFEKCRPKLKEAQIYCMRDGDTEHAMWSLSGEAWLSYMMGKPLPRLQRDCAVIVAHIEEHRQPEVAAFVKMIWQTAIKLTTCQGRFLELDGSVYSKKEYPKAASPHLGAAHFMEGELIFFSSFLTAAERAIEYGDLHEKLSPAIFTGMLEKFHRGVALYAMTRQLRKRRYRKRAYKIRKVIKQWVEDGNPNVIHYDLLLDAEHASLHKKTYDEADEFYQKAIKAATELNHPMHQGLFHERYADFLLRIQWNKDGAIHHFSKSIQYYDEWGAVGKVQQLKQEMHALRLIR
ncbi:unnamed protein product [Cylindrotheca closterium]|uniref:Orc1-like AAA ATPase domain-containing protein n=1 Tax=Cylindrotheca closterium TaxID=2856 RepID=A0AAD2CFF0_9STRA|nr:unnamed protein product [Cylindrotheca closterium]